MEPPAISTRSLSKSALFDANELEKIISLKYTVRPENYARPDLKLRKDLQPQQQVIYKVNSLTRATSSPENAQRGINYAPLFVDERLIPFKEGDSRYESLSNKKKRELVRPASRSYSTDPQLVRTFSSPKTTSKLRVNIDCETAKMSRDEEGAKQQGQEEDQVKRISTSKKLYIRESNKVDMFVTYNPYKGDITPLYTPSTFRIPQKTANSGFNYEANPFQRKVDAQFFEETISCVGSEQSEIEPEPFVSLNCTDVTKIPTTEDMEMMPPTSNAEDEKKLKQDSSIIFTDEDPYIASAMNEIANQQSLDSEADESSQVSFDKPHPIDTAVKNHPNSSLMPTSPSRIAATIGGKDADHIVSREKLAIIAGIGNDTNIDYRNLSGDYNFNGLEEVFRKLGLLVKIEPITEVYDDIVVKSPGGRSSKITSATVKPDCSTFSLLPQNKKVFFNEELCSTAGSESSRAKSATNNSEESQRNNACVECSKKAVLWCNTCQDVFCAMCWGKINHHTIMGMVPTPSSPNYSRISTPIYQVTFNDGETQKAQRNAHTSQSSLYRRKVRYFSDEQEGTGLVPTSLHGLLPGDAIAAPTPQADYVITRYNDYPLPPVCLYNGGKIEHLDPDGNNDFYDGAQRPYTSPMKKGMVYPLIRNRNHEHYSQTFGDDRSLGSIGSHSSADSAESRNAIPAYRLEKSDRARPRDRLAVRSSAIERLSPKKPVKPKERYFSERNKKKNGRRSEQNKAVEMLRARHESILRSRLEKRIYLNNYDSDPRVARLLRNPSAPSFVSSGDGRISVSQPIRPRTSGLALSGIQKDVMPEEWEMMETVQLPTDTRNNSASGIDRANRKSPSRTGTHTGGSATELEKLSSFTKSFPNALKTNFVDDLKAKTVASILEIHDLNDLGDMKRPVQTKAGVFPVPKPRQMKMFRGVPVFVKDNLQLEKELRLKAIENKPVKRKKIKLDTSKVMQPLRKSGKNSIEAMKHFD